MTVLHKLTERDVLNAGAGDLADGGGLILRIRDEGKAASWVYRYTAPSGRRREMGLGALHRGNVALAKQSLTAARAAAHEARELVRRAIDPLADREQRRQAAREADEAKKAEKSRERWTLARCARDYHEREVEPNCAFRQSQQWIRSLENHVPQELWHAPIEDITAPQLLEALQGAEAHERARNVGTLGETLRRVRGRLESVFADAMFHGRCKDNPASLIGEKLNRARPKDFEHLAALDYRKAPSLLARLRAMQGTGARCLEFAVLTASRTSEALLAEWAEVDLAAGVWTIPASRMKAKNAHVVFLAPRAVDILKGQIGQDDRYVFPSTMPGREDKPQSTMALRKVLDRLNVRDQTTVHGLCRSTFSTWANETAAARPQVIECCLAHKTWNKEERAYNRAEFLRERQALMERWGEFLAQPLTEPAAIDLLDNTECGEYGHRENMALHSRPPDAGQRSGSRIG